MKKTHKIKLNIEFCDPVYYGEKPFEIRKNDRCYQKGDLIKFIPTDYNSLPILPKKHPIEEKVYEITYVINGFGLENGYVVFGIKEV